MSIIYLDARNESEIDVGAESGRVKVVLTKNGAELMTIHLGPVRAAELSNALAEASELALEQMSNREAVQG